MHDIGRDQTYQLSREIRHQNLEETTNFRVHINHFFSLERK